MARIVIKRKGKVIFSENRTFERKQRHTLGGSSGGCKASSTGN
jgi:hypothetical protein